jgi:hypothetical protein
MTAASEQPALDLGNYRGKNILRTAIRLQNSKDGFHPSTDLEEPRIFELDEELTVAIRIKVSGHHPKVIEKGEDYEIGMVDLLQDFKCGTIAIIPDTGATRKALDAVEARRKEADKAAEKAKATAKKAARPPRRAAGAGKVVSIGDSLQQHADAGKIPGAGK